MITMSDVQTLKLEPADVLVIHVDHVLKPGERQTMRDDLKRAFPNNLVTILERGATLSVVKAGGATGLYQSEW